MPVKAEQYTAVHRETSRITLDLSKIKHDYQGHEIHLDVPVSYLPELFTEQAREHLKELFGRRDSEMQLEVVRMQIWDRQVAKFLSELVK